LTGGRDELTLNLLYNTTAPSEHKVFIFTYNTCSLFARKLLTKALHSIPNQLRKTNVTPHPH